MRQHQFQKLSPRSSRRYMKALGQLETSNHQNTNAINSEERLPKALDVNLVFKKLCAFVILRELRGESFWNCRPKRPLMSLSPRLRSRKPTPSPFVGTCVFHAQTKTKLQASGLRLFARVSSAMAAAQTAGSRQN